MELIEQKAKKKHVVKEHIPGHHKVPRIWILVADKHAVRVFKKNAEELELFGELKPLHSMHEPRMNDSHQGPRILAHEIADWLDKSVQEDAFDRLILAAAPQTLGELRKVLSHPVQARIAAEVDKDLTKMNEKELQKELTKIVWF